VMWHKHILKHSLCVLLDQPPNNVFYSFCVFSLRNFCYLPIDLHYQQRQEPDVSHLILVPPGVLGPSWWHILKQSWKALALKISW
jgi:hypothetical protein